MVQFGIVMSDLERVREKLQKIREFESYDSNWSGIRYEMNEPMALSELERFEEENGIELPEDYRGFLLEVANGGAGPGYGLYSLADSMSARGEGIYALSDPFSLELREGREDVQLQLAGGCGAVDALAQADKRYPEMLEVLEHGYEVTEVAS